MKKFKLFWILPVLVASFCLFTCNSESTGNIKIENFSSQNITHVAVISTNKEMLENPDVFIPRITGGYVISGIPAGNCYMYFTFDSYPYLGPDSPVFEVRAGKTVNVNYAGGNSWTIW